MAYIDEAEDVDNASEESCEGGDGIDSCAKWNKPKNRVQKAAARRAFASSIVKKGKKVIRKFEKKKLKPAEDTESRTYEAPTEDQSHRNVRFL